MVMVTFTASGNMAPPCIIYPYERIPTEINRNVSPSWSLGRSKYIHTGRKKMKKKYKNNKRKKKDLKRKPKKKSYKKTGSNTSNGSSEEEDEFVDTQDDSLDDAEFSDLLQSRPSTPHLEELLKDAEERNFALVKFPTEDGGKEAYYIGHVVKIKENEEISRLRQSQKCENKFFFPNVPDKAVIEKGQLVY
ncbi:uncharacterized protein LOC126880294 [Diabrotica virgifera virgifera]|uniref:Uncharacterized protein n=1 Tax=Diabrotica virgifera virgifera TaxID=50390 RepID=A0ABM5JQ07_DIAVI|nr:uncharacterized protein LOC126880294 [Diabrotica virgifera virgifera]